MDTAWKTEGVAACQRIRKINDCPAGGVKIVCDRLPSDRSKTNSMKLVSRSLPPLLTSEIDASLFESL